MIRMKSALRLIQALVFGVLVWSGSGCRRQTNGVPNVLVDVYININNPTYYTLQAVGGWSYYNGAGSQGLILFRRSLDEIACYDRHSPFEPENNCIASIDPNTNITAIDPCSGSTWLLQDGSVTQGPAVFPLQPYQTSFDGTTIHIYN